MMLKSCGTGFFINRMAIINKCQWLQASTSSNYQVMRSNCEYGPEGIIPKHLKNNCNLEQWQKFFAFKCDDVIIAAPAKLAASRRSDNLFSIWTNVVFGKNRVLLPLHLLFYNKVDPIDLSTSKPTFLKYKKMWAFFR